MQTLKDLREKVQALEIEKSNLLAEIDKMRKAAEARAEALEAEVAQMRDEVKSLKELLANNEAPTQTPLNSN